MMAFPDTLYKEILVSGAREVAIFDLFFSNRPGSSLIYSVEGCPYYLVVAGLPEGQDYRRDNHGWLPRWYISRDWDPLIEEEKRYRKAYMELRFNDRFDKGVIIQFNWMDTGLPQGLFASRQQEAQDFVSVILSRIKKVAEVTDISMSTTEETHQEENILSIIQDVARMKQHPKRSGYSPRTALVIYQAIIPAYKRYKNQGWQWGAGCFVDLLDEMSTATISRYFKDWYEEGITLFPSDLGDIPNPYHPRNASR